MKSYKDLEIYRISYDLAIRVHKMSLKLPKYEMYEEGSQIRKSSKAIASCIVEGYGRRKYKAEFTRFLTYAHASCDETKVHLNFIHDTYPEIEPAENADLMTQYDGLGAKINNFIRYVADAWIVPATGNR